MTSFYAPYHCDHCSTDFQAVIDVYVHRDAVSARKPPALPCPKCRKTARYDGELEAFLQALEKVAPAAEASSGRLPPSEALDPKGPRVERHNEGQVTRLALIGELSSSVKWRSYMDNLATDLVVDLTRTTTVSSGGISPLITALRSVTVDSIEIVACPMPLAEALRSSPLPSLKVRSVTVDGHCSKCAQTRRATLETSSGAWERTITTTVTKKAACPKCGTTLTLSRAGDTLPQRTVPFGWVIGLAAGLAFLGMVVMMVGLVMASVSGEAQGDGDMPDREVAQERLHIGDDQVSASGHGGPYSTVSEAEAAARDKAIGAIVSALAREIATKRGMSAGVIEVSPSEVGRFLETLQIDPAGLLVDSKIKEGEGGFEVEARYALPRARFDAIATDYAAEKDWAGLRLVRPFPPSQGLRVVKSDIAELEPGSRIVRVGETALARFEDLPGQPSGQTLVVQDPDGTEREIPLP